MTVDAVRCWFASTIECSLIGEEFVESAATQSCVCHWRSGGPWYGVGSVSFGGGHLRCGRSLESMRSVPVIPCHSPHKFPASSHRFDARSLHDHWMCNVHSVSFPIPFFVHGHPIPYYFLIIAIYKQPQRKGTHTETSQTRGEEEGRQCK